jgi:hypothetical protein
VEPAWLALSERRRVLVYRVALALDAAGAVACHAERAEPELARVATLPATAAGVAAFLAEDARPRVDYLEPVLRADAGA